MKKCGIVFLVVVVMIAFGCGKKDAPAAPETKTDKVAAPVAAAMPIEGWAMAEACRQDEAKALTEYVGKTIIVKNLVIYTIYEEEKKFDAFAYDPATNTISTTGKLRLNGAEAKATEADFYFTVTLANAADLPALKASTPTETAGGRISDFAGPYAFEAKVEKIEGNNIYLIGAKPTAK